MGERNDLEYDKFSQNTLGDVVVDFTEVTEDPLNNPEQNIEDLETEKFTTTGTVRAVFTN